MKSEHPWEKHRYKRNHFQKSTDQKRKHAHIHNMSDFKLAAVEAKCRELLRTVDVETLSERQIRERLAQDLGFPVDDFKPLIVSLVDEFVQKERAEEEEVLRSPGEQPPQPLTKKQKVSGVDEEDLLRSKWEGPPPPAAQKEAAFAVKREAAPPPPSAAAERVAPKEDTVKDEDAEKNLKQTLETIFDALEDYGANGTTAKVISEATKMDKSEVNRVLYLCLKRGMDLRLTHDSKKAPPTWALDVTKEKGSGGGAAAAKSGGTQQQQQQQQRQQQQQQQQAEDAVDGEVCRLSNAKRVAVQVYRGAPTISFREYYPKEGQWLPGKKGVNLNAEQFENLREKIADVEIKIDIVAAGNSESEAVCEIGGNKRVTVSKYQGKPMVHVREYYQNKNGEWAPGFKGLAFNREQWEMFVNHADEISAKIETM